MAAILMAVMMPAAFASSITPCDVKVKHDYGVDGVEDGIGQATMVEMESGYYVSPWKYDVKSVSITCEWKGQEQKLKTEEIKVEPGVEELKLYFYAEGGKLKAAPNGQPEEADKVAKIKFFPATNTMYVIAKTEGVKMSVKYKYKDAKQEAAKDVEAYPLNEEHAAASFKLIQDFKAVDNKTELVSLIEAVDGVYFASRWDYKIAEKDGGPNIDCKCIYGSSYKKAKGEEMKYDVNGFGSMVFFLQDGKLDVDDTMPEGATKVADVVMNVDGAIWFTPVDAAQVSAELEFNYAADSKIEDAKNVDAWKIGDLSKRGAAPEQPAEKPAFADVPKGLYCYDAVQWAVEKEITAGTAADASTFSPGRTCTRAEILTYLWRAQGKPEAKIENPFTDAAESDYFYQAALWASENGLAAGAEFHGAAPCTRSQTMVYLWELAGKPEAAAASFTDVAADAPYAQAVAWAVEQGITAGTAADAFSPDRTCTRGEIVTFLSRAMAE